MEKVNQFLTAMTKSSYLIKEEADVLSVVVVISPNSSFLEQPLGLGVYVDSGTEESDSPDIVNIVNLSAVLLCPGICGK